MRFIAKTEKRKKKNSIECFFFLFVFFFLCPSYLLKRLGKTVNST